MVKGSELAIRKGAGLESFLGDFHLVVQCFTSSTDSIVRLFSPLAVLLFLWYFSSTVFGLNTITFHYLPPTIPPQAFSLMPPR